MKKEKTLFDKFIQILTHQVDKSPMDLKKYDVVIFGGTVSCLMTKQIVKFTHGHKTVFHSSTNKDMFMTPLRIPFEARRFEETFYGLTLSEAMELSVAKDPSNPIKKLLPNENAVELSNGRRIEYEALILEPQLQQVPETIPGLLEGLNRADGRVYAPVSKAGNPLYYGFFPLFENGNAFIYIPEFPFENEVEQFNFLSALSTWELGEKYGAVSPIRHLTIINANDRFASKCNVLNDFIMKKLSTHPKVDVLFNTKLKSINNKDQTLLVEDKSGNQKTFEFNRVYVHIPTAGNQQCLEAGLIKPGKKQIEVDPKSLLVKGYDNIFAYGEGVDLPVQPSFGAFNSQAQVVRHNALEYVDGRRPNAEYGGETKMAIFTGTNSATFYSAAYNKEPKISQGWLIERLWYYYIIKSYAKSLRKVYMSKKAGGPKSKFVKYPKGEQVRQVAHSEHH